MDTTIRPNFQIVIDDTVYTVMKAQANYVKENDYVVLLEDAYGDTTVSVVNEDDLPQVIKQHLKILK